MEINADATSLSIKVFELKFKQPDVKQEQADSAHSQNSRYQSSESFKYSESYKYSESKSSGSSGYCGKPNSGESSSQEAEKEKDSCDSTAAQKIDEKCERNKPKERYKEFCKSTNEIFEKDAANNNNEMAGCDAVIACEYTIKYDETKQMLDTNSHEVLYALPHENESHHKMETSDNHERIDGKTTVVHMDFEKIIDLPDNDYQLKQADSELPTRPVIEQNHGYSGEKLNCTQPESFCCTVSMHDGTIVAVTEHLTNLLGYPHDSLIGQPFVNFLHPNDRTPFANKMRLSIGSGSDYENDDNDHQNAPENITYALLRDHRLFESNNVGIPCKKVVYKPFKLILCVAPMMSCESMSITSEEDHSLLRIICAIEIKSIYKVPDEDMSKKNQRFSTRHTATGVMVHIDGIAAAAIGFLPHEIIGQSIFDFYHPNDLSELRNMYKTLTEHSSIGMDTISGQPYRFLIKNGCYITIETKWRRTFNPWTREVEFIIGAHCILKGPKQCNNIFTEAGKYACNYSDEILKNAERIQNEITRILAQPIPLPPVDKKLLLSKQCLELTKYMEKFRNEVKKKEYHTVVDGNFPNLKNPIMQFASLPRRNSRYDNSDNSSETPPTYQILNYQENLNRYFNSDPVESMPPDFDLTDTLNEPIFKWSPIQKGSEKSGDSGKLSVSSTDHMASLTNTNGNSNQNSGKEIEPLDQVLTSKLINQHTKAMETMLMKSHKRSRIAKNDKESRMKNNPELNYYLNARNPPMKRSHPSTSESELNEICAKHQYKNVTHKESQSERLLVGQINQFALLNNINFMPVIHYVSGAAPINYANEVEGIRLNENKRDRQTFTNSNGEISSLISQSNAQNTHACQYMNNLLNQSRQSNNSHVIYPYTSLTFKPLTLPALHTEKGKETEMVGQATNQPERCSKRTSTATKVTLAKYSRMTKYVTEKIDGKLLEQSKEKYTTSDETECSSSSFYSSQLRTVEAIKIENPIEDKVRSERLPWSENVYKPDFGYRIQPQDLDTEIQSCVEAMKHMEQSNMVREQLSHFLAESAVFNGRQPYVTVGDTSSDSDDDEISNNLIAVQCQSVEALLYEENASFPTPNNNMAALPHIVFECPQRN